MIKELKADFKRYYEINKLSGLNKISIFFKQEVWSILVYRFGNYIHRNITNKLIKFPLKMIAFIFYKIVETISGITIPFSTKIGEGLFIAHFSGIIVHSNAVIGNNCVLGTGVIIGNRSLGDSNAPIIGDNVFIGVGAKVLGEITIGNNVKIGANAVVLKDVPDNATVVGNPSIIIIK